MNQMKPMAGEAYPWRPDRTEPELRAHAAAVARRKKARVRLWLPLTPLFILLAPFALIAAPLIDLDPRARGVSPWRVAWGVGAVLLSTHGTVVEVDSPAARISIRIF